MTKFWKCWKSNTKLPLRPAAFRKVWWHSTAMNYNQPRKPALLCTNHGKITWSTNCLLLIPVSSIPARDPTVTLRRRRSLLNLRLATLFWVVSSPTPGSIPIYTHQIQSNPQFSMNKTSTNTQNIPKALPNLPPSKKQTIHIIYGSFTIISHRKKNIFPSVPWRLRAFPPSEAKLSQKPQVC